MPIGQVKFFKVDKGYGFIRPEVPGDDIFLHVSALGKANPPIKVIHEGDFLSYEIEDGRKGPAAGKVRLLARRG